MPSGEQSLSAWNNRRSAGIVYQSGLYPAIRRWNVAGVRFSSYRALGQPGRCFDAASWRGLGALAAWCWCHGYVLSIGLLGTRCGPSSFRAVPARDGCSPEVSRHGRPGERNWGFVGTIGWTPPAKALLPSLSMVIGGNGPNSSPNSASSAAPVAARSSASTGRPATGMCRRR